MLTEPVDLTKSEKSLCDCVAKVITVIKYYLTIKHLLLELRFV